MTQIYERNRGRMTGGVPKDVRNTHLFLLLQAHARKSMAVEIMSGPSAKGYEPEISFTSMPCIRRSSNRRWGEGSKMVVCMSFWVADVMA